MSVFFTSYILPPFLMAIVGWLSKNGLDLIKSGFNYLESKTKSQLLLQVLSHAECAALFAFQTVLKPLERELADGKITLEDFKRLRREAQLEAKERAVKKLRSSLKKMPGKAVEYFEDELEDLIESVLPVVKAKQRGIAALDPTKPEKA